MNNMFSIILVVAGIVLVVFGVNAMDSFSSDVSRFFSGNPTDRSMWFLIGGIVAIAVGLGMAGRTYFLGRSS
jgi:uncharacterized membrane-anchored protein